MTEVELREDLKAEVKATIQSWEQRRGRVVNVVRYAKSDHDEYENDLSCEIAPELPKCPVCRQELTRRYGSSPYKAKGVIGGQTFFCSNRGCVMKGYLIIHDTQV